MHTADIAKSTQCWCEWILSSRFSPLRSAHAPLTCSGNRDTALDVLQLHT